eukprot:g2759.t1
MNNINGSLAFGQDKSKFLRLKRSEGAKPEDVKIRILAGEEYLDNFKLSAELEILLQHFRPEANIKPQEGKIVVYAPKNFTVRPDVEINQMAKDIADKKGAGMIVLCNNKNERNKLTKAYDRQREKIEIRIPVIAILENQNVSFNIKNAVQDKKTTAIILHISDKKVSETEKILNTGKKTSGNERIPDRPSANNNSNPGVWNMFGQAASWGKRLIVGLNFGLAKKLKKDCIDNVQLGWVDSANNKRYEVAHGILHSYYQQHTENYDEVEQELEKAFSVLKDWRSLHSRNQDILYLLFIGEVIVKFHHYYNEIAPWQIEFLEELKQYQPSDESQALYLKKGGH